MLLHGSTTANGQWAALTALTCLTDYHAAAVVAHMPLLDMSRTLLESVIHDVDKPRDADAHARMLLDMAHNGHAEVLGVEPM